MGDSEASIVPQPRPAPEMDGDVKTKADRAKEVMDSPVVVHSNYVPAQLHRQLEFIEFNKDGHMILGCSDLTGRCWSGSLWYYRDPKEAPSVEKALTGVDCDNGVVDGRFIGDKSKHILIALDHGAVEHVALSFSDEGEGSVPNPGSSSAPHPSSFFYLERMAFVQEHDDIISGLDLNCDGKRLVTCSYDKSVVSLDVDTLRLESRLDNVHPDLISNISASKTSSSVIATSSNDGTCVIWDLKSPTEKVTAYNDLSDWPTCVEWVPRSDHHLLVGTQSGKVHLYDIRQPAKPTDSIEGIGKQIYQFKFSAKRPKTFAISGDSCQIKIVDIDEGFASLTTRASDEIHDDFVRGLAWHPQSDVLFSCGWDHKLVHHDDNLS